MATLKDAGDVTVNEFALTNFGGFNYYNYIGLDTLFHGNEARWQVAGNSANAIAGFSHTDNIPFPTGGDFTLPERINITQNFTINYTPINNAYGIVYSVKGNKGQKNKAVLGGGSSVTFSAAELSAAAFANDAIAFSIMPLALAPASYNGKKYYFVKQFQYARETKTF